MAFGIYHSDGTTRVDSDTPLECRHLTPAEAILKCDPEEQTTQPVTLTLPAEFEASVDDGASYADAPEPGVVSSGTPLLIRTKEAHRYEGVALTTARLLFGGVELVPDTTPPSQVTGLDAVGGAGMLNLAWNAATDNRGLDHYEYAYGTAANFAGATTGSTASRVLATSVAAGTYYARVRAVDAAGNQGAWSATASTVVASAADTTSPTLGGTLTAVPGSGKVALDWADATDNVGVTGYDVQYKLSSDGAWLDWAPDPVASSLIVTGLTRYVAWDFRVRAHDAAGNVSAWLTVTGVVPFFLNDFSLGEAVDAADIGTSVANGGTVAVYDTGGAAATDVLRLYETAANHGGLWYLKNAINTALNRRYTVRFMPESAADSGGLTLPIAVSQEVGTPAPGTVATVNPKRRMQVACNANGTITAVAYFNAANTQKSWNFSTGAWQTAAGTAAEQYASLNGTFYRAVLECDYNAGTPRFRFIIQNEAGVTVTNGTTAWVPFSDLYNNGGGSYYVHGGDIYTEYYYSEMWWSFIRVEAF